MPVPLSILKDDRAFALWQSAETMNRALNEINAKRDAFAAVYGYRPSFARDEDLWADVRAKKGAA